METRKPKRRNSGQILVITSLIIALLLVSVFNYIFEVSRKSPTQTTTSLSNYFLAIELGSRNTIVSSLANVSNGGENDVITANLNKLCAIIGGQPYFGKCNLLFTSLNSTPYQSGIWISWGSGGSGISSAYANFALNFTGIQANAQFTYNVNVTTSLSIEGVYTKLTGVRKQVNVTCKVFNEGKHALARNIAMYYESDGDLAMQEWVLVDSPSIVDYGNGTYFISFIVETQTRLDPVIVSAHVLDLREIFVQANATCSEV